VIDFVCPGRLIRDWSLLDTREQEPVGSPSIRPAWTLAVDADQAAAVKISRPCRI